MKRKMKSMITFIKDNAGWLNILLTLGFAVMVLWLNANYTTKQEFTQHVKTDIAEQTELNKTLNSISMNITLLQKDNQEHKEMMNLIKDIDSKLMLLEHRVTILEVKGK